MKHWLVTLAGWAICACATLSGTAYAAEFATLTVAVGAQPRMWTREALLHNPHLTDVTVEDENLKRRLTFKAVPVTEFFKGQPTSPDASATTVASDGYVSHLPMRLLLADRPDGPRAWLAVEDPDTPWPTLKGQDIGPFRLIDQVRGRPQRPVARLGLGQLGGDVRARGECVCRPGHGRIAR